MRKFLMLFTLLGALSACASTFESDKKRLVVVTFGFGVAFFSDKEVKAEVSVGQDKAEDKDTKKDNKKDDETPVKKP